MSLVAALRAAHPPPAMQRAVPWLGALFIAAIVALGAWDAWRGYQAAVEDTGRELNTQARIIAEHTARSLQAVDVVLRHLEEQHRAGALDRMSDFQLHQYLKEQAVGLVQIEGLLVLRADGTPRAVSMGWPMPEPLPNVTGYPVFERMRAGTRGLATGTVMKSDVDHLWVIPLARRIETPEGRFAGAVGARGRIDYFQRFYRDIALDPGTNVTLMHNDGTLAARHPPADEQLGRRFPLFDEMQSRLAGGGAAPLRAVSPIDGVDRFAALQAVPDHPFSVIVTRDAAAALAPWRHQATGSALRTLALAALAALLLAFTVRHLARLQAARESLEAAQERFALAVDGSDDGLWDWERSTNLVFSSPRARELLGIPDTPPTLPVPAYFAALQIHPDDRARQRAAFDAHIAGKTPAYEIELRFRQPDGRYRWVRSRGVCVRDAGGRAMRMAGSVSDIDARRRAEEALRESEQRFALAVAGSNDGIVDWDIVHDRLYASERALRILGSTAPEGVRTQAEWAALFTLHPEDRERQQEDFRRHLEGATEVRDGEYRFRQPDGAWRWVRLRAMAVRDEAGRAVRWAGSVSDVDARRRTEEALRRSEERYQLAVAGSNEGLWDWDLRRDELFLSARAQTLLGLAPSEPLRTRRAWVDSSIYHPEDFGRVRAALSAHLRGQTPHFEVEYRMRHADGSWHWYRQRGIAVRDAEGKPYRLAGSMEDITRRRTAEAERDTLERQLRQAQKLEAIGTLAGGIAHDFNNILAAILGFGEMAQKEAAEGSAQRRHIDAALAAGLRAKSLVERILAFSRSGVGERVPVHVASVVEEALDAVAASLPRGVALERRLALGDAAVMGDPTQIHQVVMNLCANAVQAVKAEGRIAVSAEPVALDAPHGVATCTLAPGAYLRLSVADTGVGIAPQVLERVFDPFFTTKEVGVGTGLGLSLVHGIVADLGGGIEVQSRLGEGSTFTVWLPWRDAVAAPAAEPAEVPQGRGEAVLLVDDEEPLVRLGEEMVASLGYEPVGFTSGAAALAAVRDEPARFACVLSDESMPELTGSELARELRRLAPGLPIVLMSGFVTPALTSRAREIGVAEVLGKPLAARDIARALAQALRR